MFSSLARLAIVLLIVYASFFGGVIETDPIVKIVYRLSSGLLIALWLVSLLLRRRPFPITRMDWPLWALGGGWFVVAMLGEDPRVSFEFVWTSFVHIILFFIFIDVIRSSHQRWLFDGLFITGGVFVLLGAIEMIMWYFGIPMLPGGTGQGWPEVGGYTIPPFIRQLSVPLQHNNPTGAYMVILIPLALAWSNTSDETGLKWTLRALAVGLVGGVLLTQSRGAYLALVALAGFMALIWLLRPDVRVRFPRYLQPFVSPHVVLTVTALLSILAFFILYWIIIEADPPNPNDATRLDLWNSAVQIFEDHPITGVGALQFMGIRLFYPNWPYSPLLLPMYHAHNILFHILAEGGILILTLSLWVLVRFGRVWKSAWTHAPAITRRRLEGILAAMFTFGVHNMVDTFLRTQFMIPMLVMLAYVVAYDGRPAAEPRPTVSSSKERFGLAIAVLVLGQVAFIPMHRGALKQYRFLNLMEQERYVEALEVVREAQEVDPWLDLYVLQEATVLGVLAADAPEVYLTDAIEAFQAGLALNSAWDPGWHNLAALYAQAGDYQRAVEAEKTANKLNSLAPEYKLKLGEYYELAGDWDNARTTYLEVLGRNPWLASSDFWKHPAHPERLTFLDDAISHYMGMAEGIDLSVYSGAFERVTEMAESTVSIDVQRQLRALWPDDTGIPCLYCYYVLDNEPLLEAEILFHTERITPEVADRIETLARKAIFLDDPKAEWGWYILARLAEHRHLSEDEIERYLSRAVSFPDDYRRHFPLIYQSQGKLDIIPQARAPLMSQVAYEPWVKLAARQVKHGDVKEAIRRYEMILKLDPYTQEIPEQLGAAHTTLSGFSFVTR